MGSNMKPTIFNERVAKALRTWHQAAREQIKKNNQSGLGKPLSSTPLHGSSPVHLLSHYKSELKSVNASPRAFIHKTESWPQENDDNSWAGSRIL